MNQPLTPTRPTPGRGLNFYYLLLELKRQVTQPTTLFFCIILSPLFYALFSGMEGMDESLGHGNVSAAMALFMALYGASMTAAISTVNVSFEVPLGWNRTLRLTPLRPWAYITTKILNALLGSVLSMGVLYIVVLIMGKAHMVGWLWLAGFGIGFICGVTFGALGLLLGSFFKGETATGILIPTLLFCCFLSGVFGVPLTGNFFIAMQKVVPMGGAVNLILALFGPNATMYTGIGGMALGDWRIWVNIGAWLFVLLAGAAIAYARNTKRQ